MTALTTVRAPRHWYFTGGAMHHLDYVASILPNSRVVGFLDSPMWMNIDPMDPELTSLMDQTHQVVQLANVSLSDNCQETYGEAVVMDWEWKCAFGQYAVPLLQTEFLMVASQYDAFQLGQNGISGVDDDSLTGDEQQYTYGLGLRMQALVKSVLPSSSLNANASVLSWSCFNHAISTSSGYNTVATDSGVTQDDALRSVLEQGMPQRWPTDWIDSCDGIACGSGC